MGVHSRHAADQPGKETGELPVKGTGERLLSQGRGPEETEGGPRRRTDRAKALRQGPASCEHFESRESGDLSTGRN